jgi:RNA polymerase sigma factor (sigma-70 family)
MTEAIAGDLDKFGILYERYKMPLYSYFYKLTGGQEQSTEDLVHNVFYRALKYRHQYKGEGSFAGWLFTIAHNVGIDFHRNEKREVFQHVEIKDGHSWTEESHDLEKEERSGLLLKALSRLKTAEREILLLSKQECLKYKEIAEILRCNENAVKIKIFRALKKLKEIYSKLETDTKIHTYDEKAEKT